MVTKKPSRAHEAKGAPTPKAVEKPEVVPQPQGQGAEESAKPAAKGSASVKSYDSAETEKAAVQVEGPEVYQRIIRAIHPLMEGARERLKGYFHGSVAADDGVSSEAPHKSRPGFVPFVDGGWEVGVIARGFSEGDGKGKGLGPEFHQGVSEILRRRDAFALTLLQDTKDWPLIIRFIGEKRDYQPKDLTEVRNRIFEKGGEKADIFREAIEDLVQEQQFDADDRVDLEVKAWVYLPGNDQNAMDLSTGLAEILVQGRIGYGEYSMPRNRAEQDEFWGPTVSVGVNPERDSEADIAARVKVAIGLVQEWMEGRENRAKVARAVLIPGGDYRIFPAGTPKEGEWVLAWQSGAMSGPAFRYFASEKDARGDLEGHMKERKTPAVRLSREEAHAIEGRFAEHGICAMYGAQKGHGFWLSKTTREVAMKTHEGDTAAWQEAIANGSMKTLIDPTNATGNEKFWRFDDAMSDLKRLEDGQPPRIFGANTARPLCTKFPRTVHPMRLMSELGVGQPAEVAGRPCMTTNFRSNQGGLAYEVEFTDLGGGVEWITPISGVRFLDPRVAESIFYGRPHKDFIG